MGKQLIIYYLDDDIDELFFVSTAAKRMGHTILTFTDGNVLLNALEHEDNKPNFVFFDEFMAHKRGTELLQEVRETGSCSKIPMVIFSESCPGFLVDAYWKAGADYVVEKPAALEGYSEIIKLFSEMEPPFSDRKVIRAT